VQLRLARAAGGGDVHLLRGPSQPAMRAVGALLLPQRGQRALLHLRLCARRALMSRSRLIHPAAPTDELLARCSIHARLVWAYLPCHADRQGRMADKPFELRPKIFPYDDISAQQMDGYLAELARPGPDGEPPLIVRYQVAGRRFIAIRSFDRYQNPHRNEADSRIPPPADSAGRSSVPSPRGTNAFSPERSGDPDPDPVSDPVTDPVIDPVRADPDPEARARVIPDLVAAVWPGQQPESVRVNQAVVRRRAPPPAAPGREAPGLRAQRLVDMFSRVRSEVGQANKRGVVSWDHGPGDFAKALDFVERRDADVEPVTVGEVERTMRAHLEWAVRQPERKHFEVGWAFGAWLHRFSDWLEEVRGLRAPELPGLTDRERENLRNSQLWLRMKEQEEERSR
jgi:hypothetical protein